MFYRNEILMYMQAVCTIAVCDMHLTYGTLYTCVYCFRKGRSSSYMTTSVHWIVDFCRSLQTLKVAFGTCVFQQCCFSTLLIRLPYITYVSQRCTDTSDPGHFGPKTLRTYQSSDPVSYTHLTLPTILRV